jgi:glycosyltransferase involved in cell wall biosynthesis
MIVMKRVVHLGPSESKGGMAAVIENMAKNAPDGWISEIISTHADSAIRSIIRWRNGLREFSSGLKVGRYDIAHVHVTHSMSWWRKLSFIKKCEKFDIPVVIHIHSGKFDVFCSGFAGKSVRKTTYKKNRKTVVLEERWRKKLSDWIPPDSEVVRNFASPIHRGKKFPGRKIKLLVLSRRSPIKRHEFAIDVVECINNLGREASLSITGGRKPIGGHSSGIGVSDLGWVSKEERESLLSESDFLLSPSKYEGASMSIIESMVSGIPCLASRASEETVGVKELIIEEENPEKWAERILELSNSQDYPRVVDLVLARAEKYSPSLNKKKIGEVYENLLRSHDSD